MAGRGSRGWPLAILVFGILAYLPSLDGVFVFDDLPWIVDNGDLQQAWPPWAAARGTSRPLLFFTLAVNHALSGLAPWSYHLTNLAIHLGTALLLFGGLRRLLASERLLPRRAGVGPRALAGATILLWTTHPLATQAVTYVIQRGESMASLFMVLSFYALLRSACPSISAAAKHRWWVVVIVGWWAAMATKEIAVTLPVLLILFDILLVTGKASVTWRERRVLYLALWLPILLGVAWLLASRPQHLAALFRGDAETFGRFDYLMSQPGVILQYLQMVIWPRGLQVDHGWPVATLSQAALPVCVALGVLVIIGVGLRHRAPWSFIGIWFVGLLAPTSSLVPLRDLLVEHRMYLPLVAPLFLVVWLGSRLSRRELRFGVLAAAVVVMTGLTADRNRDYQSELSLWTPGTATEQNARRFYNLQLELVFEEGGVLEGPLLGTKETDPELQSAARALQQGDTATALQQLSRVSKPSAANLRGLALWMAGRQTEAMGEWERPGAPHAAKANLAVALWLSGDVVRAEQLLRGLVAGGSTMAEVHYNLGTLQAGQGRLDEARPSLERALILRPNMSAALNNLGAVAEGGGDLDAAATGYAQSAQQGQPTARLNQGLLCVRRRQYRRALPILDEVMASHPVAAAASARALARYFTGNLDGATEDLVFARQSGRSAALANNLGCIRMALGELELARQLFDAALQADPEQTAAHHNLGKLLILLDEPVQAIPHLRQAAASRPDDAVIRANLHEAESRVAH